MGPNLFVGLYVEKGIGQAAAPAFSKLKKSQRMIMRDTWIWHDFSRALADGIFEHQVSQASDQTASPMIVALDAQMATPTIDWNEERPRLPRDYIRFVESPAVERSLLQPFNDATSLKDVSERIAALPELDWIWIDFYAGYTFAIDPQEGMSEYDSEAVWAAAGAPWKDWLRLTQTKR